MLCDTCSVIFREPRCFGERLPFNSPFWSFEQPQRDGSPSAMAACRLCVILASRFSRHVTGPDSLEWSPKTFAPFTYAIHRCLRDSVNICSISISTSGSDERDLPLYYRLDLVHAEGDVKEYSISALPDLEPSF